MSSNLVHAKLVNGDEIITVLIYEDDECYIFGEPMALEQRLNTISGSNVTVLVKYVHVNETKELLISKSHVITVLPVHSIIEKYYTISKIYNEKYVEPNMLNEIEKVSAAMEDILYTPTPKANEVKIKSTSNNTIH